jgi:hypothetical protein
MKQLKPLVPVIMVSGNCLPGQALRWVDCFVAKEQGPEVLLELIAELLTPRPAWKVTGNLSGRNMHLDAGRSSLQGN